MTLEHGNDGSSVHKTMVASRTAVASAGDGTGGGSPVSPTPSAWGRAARRAMRPGDGLEAPMRPGGGGGAWRGARGVDGDQRRCLGRGWRRRQERDRSRDRDTGEKVVVGGLEWIGRGSD
jgi:hypothetical protein